MPKQFREAQIVFYLNRANYIWTCLISSKRRDVLIDNFYKRAIRELSRPIKEGEK